MKFQEFLNQKINEYYGDEATEFLGFGKGGELDDMLSSIGGFAKGIAIAGGITVALIAKGLINRSKYKKLKSILPEYIEKYQKAGAPESHLVFKNSVNQKIKQLKDKIREINGDENTPSAEDKIRKSISSAISRAKTGAQKDALRQKRDQALEKLNKATQQIRKEIQQLEDDDDIQWERAKDDFQNIETQIEELQSSFLETRGFGSSWSKKWEKEFSIAKREAELEVLKKAKQIAREDGDEDELNKIENLEKKSQNRLDKAEEDLTDILSDAEKDEENLASAEEYGISQMIDAVTAYDTEVSRLYVKWQNRVSGESESSSQKDEIQNKIDKAEKLLKRYTEQGNDKKAGALKTAILKLKKQLENLKESFLFEEKKRPTIAGIGKLIQQAINKAPKDDQKQVRSEGAKDINNLIQLKNSYVKARNNMVEKFSERADQEPSERDKLPKGMEEFSKVKSLDSDEEIQPLKEIISKIGGKTDIKKSEPEPEKDQSTNQDNQEPEDNQEKPKENENIKRMEKEIEDLIAAKKELEDKPNKNSKDRENIGILNNVIPIKQKNLEKEKEKQNENVFISFSNFLKSRLYD